MPSYLLVANPFSGKGLREKHIGRIVELFARSGAHVDIVRTRGPGEGTEAVARRRKDHTAIIAAGGDGTINEVINGLAGDKVPIGVIARGTANVLATELDIPRSLDRAVEVILRGKTLPLDVGIAGQRRFILMASAGYDAQVVVEAHRKRTRWFSRAHFLWPMLKVLWRGKFPEIRVEMDGRREKCRHVVIANVPGYGGPFRPAPHAIYNDGLFDIVMYMQQGRFNMFRYGMLAFCSSKTAQDGDIYRTRARRVTLSSREPVSCQLDGDPFGELPVTIDIKPDGALLIVP